MILSTTRAAIAAAVIGAGALAGALLPGLVQQGGDPFTVNPDPGAPQRHADLAFRRALALAGVGRWSFAISEAVAAGPVARDIIEWQRLRAGQGVFTDYPAFEARHRDWPGMDLLRRKAEDKLTGTPPEAVIGWFAQGRPQTVTGTLALIAALDAKDRRAEADKVAQTAWRGLQMTAAEQAAFLQGAGPRVAGQMEARITAMLDQGAVDQAAQMLDLVAPDVRALALARIALQKRGPGVDKLVQAVPDTQAQAPGLAFDRAQWRWRVGQEDGAAQIVHDRSVLPQTLGEPAEWATLRAQLARFYLRKGDFATAYDLASTHRMPVGGADWSDLEWLAGYAALRMGDPTTALGHFDTFAAGVKSPISVARAAYWQGRALDALGRTDEAQAAWRRGATWQTAFYGLLSAEKAGVPLDPQFTWPVSLPPWQDQPFTRTSLFAAADLLHRVGEGDLARRFLLQLEETQPPGQLAPMAALAGEWGDAKLALVLAKRAADGGDVLVRAYYPLPGLPTGDLQVPEELALSIARRESEFDPAAISHSGALGLMQLMPGTAQLMAAAVGEGFSKARLTADPAYNIRLGSAYLARLRGEFGTSPVLVASGYNAGPVRARRWIADMGDPRDPAVDLVDWVEMIPYDETRNYVMRVAESVPVYRARLGGDAPGPLAFTQELRGTPPVAAGPETPEGGGDSSADTIPAPASAGATPPADTPSADAPPAPDQPAAVAAPAVTPAAPASDTASDTTAAPATGQPR